MTEKTAVFLRSTGMAAECIELEPALAEFGRQMRAGLAGRDSSLMMLPSFISLRAAPRSRRVIALDAGGTNLRAAVIAFDSEGRPTVEYQKKQPMPGSYGEMNGEEFFAAIADTLEPIADASDTVGFCFSFVMDVLPDRDARIVAFSKELRVTGADGAVIGQALNQELSRRGHAPKRFTLLNDTVAALLSGAAGPEDYDGHIGFILGTGTNCCYTERGERIEKLPGTTGSMVINMESGIYTGFVRGDFDRELDDASEIPGDHLAEKMVSGAYLGDLVFRTVRGAASAGLFSEGFAARLDKRKSFETAELGAFAEGAENALTAGNKIDAETLQAIVTDAYDRAARILAVMFTAIMDHTDTGRGASRPCCITAEGSTYHKSPLLQKRLEHYLQSWTAAVHGRHCRIVRCDDATVIGAAVAAAQE